jgi:hypothetical protein
MQLHAATLLSDSPALDEPGWLLVNIYYDPKYSQLQTALETSDEATHGII